MSNVHVNPRHARANTPQQVVCLLAPRTHNTQPKTATGRQQDTPSRVTDDSTAIEPHTLRCDVDWRARALCRFRARSTKTKRREGRAAARASESRAFPQPISKNAAPSSANNPLKQQHRQGTQRQCYSLSVQTKAVQHSTNADSMLPIKDRCCCTCRMADAPAPSSSACFTMASAQDGRVSCRGTSPT